MCARVGKRQAALQLPRCHTAPESPTQTQVNAEERHPPPDAIRGTGGSLSDAAELRLLGQCPLSEHAMTEITVMRLSRQGGLGMLGSTCCTDAHKC